MFHAQSPRLQDSGKPSRISPLTTGTVLIRLNRCVVAKELLYQQNYS
jgi:hypothetical protein